MENQLLKLIENKEGLYSGDLVYYFKKVFYAPNVKNPYHNFRHICHFACEVYDAIKYYGSNIQINERRAMLIAALYHDFGHQGIIGNDEENIIKAQNFLKEHILPEDKPLLELAFNLIKVTQFPHVNLNKELLLVHNIFRDVDMSQTFTDVWLQQVIFGLSTEYGIEPIEMLERQTGFIQQINFYTNWAKEKFENKRIEKLYEVEQLLKMVK